MRGCKTISTMKKILLIAILLPMLGKAQEISVDRYKLKFNTTFHGSELKYIDSLFNTSQITILITKLLPVYEGESCYEESIIIEEFDWEKSKQDSIFAGEYFTGVRYWLIDSLSVTQIDSVDYQFFLQEILEGPRKLNENELIDLCYNPRHAVIFKDENNNIIAIQEICFECHHTKVAIYTSAIHHNTSFPFKALFKKYHMIK